MTDMPHAFAALTPDAVLDAVDALGNQTDGRQLALNSYENRVYQVGIEDGPPLIAKFYRPQRWSEQQILEEHAFAHDLLEAEIPVVAPLRDVHGCSLHCSQGLDGAPGFFFALYPRRGGRSPELDNEETLKWLGRFIGRIHQVGGRERFASRPTLDIASFGEEPRDWLLTHDFIPHDLLAAWTSTVDAALIEVHACFQRVGPARPLRLHGDCHASNILWTDAGPHFVDLDDARMGPAVQDLWLLLSGDREQMSSQLGAILSGYEQFREFDRSELGLIEALRTLRLIHYAAWIARRWDDPAFPIAFPWFSSPRYWQDRILELREQIALMQEPALVAL